MTFFQAGFSKLKETQDMQHLSSIDSLRILTPQIMGINQPRRKLLPLLPSNNAFVKPVKQSFVTNPRMMPQTRCMLLMLLGWAGQEQAIETTIGIIAKKIGRSRRQVFRYLQDAIEEGYLFYSRTKNRMGYYTGIKIHLNFLAIKPRKPAIKSTKNRRNKDVTLESDTNNKHIYKRGNTPSEQRFLDKMDNVLRRNNLIPDKN